MSIEQPKQIPVESLRVKQEQLVSAQSVLIGRKNTVSNLPKPPEVRPSNPLMASLYDSMQKAYQGSAKKLANLDKAVGKISSRLQTLERLIPLEEEWGQLEGSLKAYIESGMINAEVVEQSTQELNSARLEVKTLFPQGKDNPVTKLAVSDKPLQGVQSTVSAGSEQQPTETTSPRPGDNALVQEAAVSYQGVDGTSTTSKVAKLIGLLKLNSGVTYEDVNNHCYGGKGTSSAIRTLIKDTKQWLEAHDKKTLDRSVVENNKQKVSVFTMIPSSAAVDEEISKASVEPVILPNRKTLTPIRSKIYRTLAGSSGLLEVATVNGEDVEVVNYLDMADVIKLIYGTFSQDNVNALRVLINNLNKEDLAEVNQRVEIYSYLKEERRQALPLLSLRAEGAQSVVSLESTPKPEDKELGQAVEIDPDKDNPKLEASSREKKLPDQIVPEVIRLSERTTLEGRSAQLWIALTNARVFEVDQGVEIINAVDQDELLPLVMGTDDPNKRNTLHQAIVRLKTQLREESIDLQSDRRGFGELAITTYHLTFSEQSVLTATEVTSESEEPSIQESLISGFDRTVLITYISRYYSSIYGQDKVAFEPELVKEILEANSEDKAIIENLPAASLEEVALKAGRYIKRLVEGGEINDIYEKLSKVEQDLVLRLIVNPELLEWVKPEECESAATSAIASSSQDENIAASISVSPKAAPSAALGSTTPVSVKKDKATVLDPQAVAREREKKESETRIRKLQRIHADIERVISNTVNHIELEYLTDSVGDREYSATYIRAKSSIPDALSDWAVEGGYVEKVSGSSTDPHYDVYDAAMLKALDEIRKLTTRSRQGMDKRTWKALNSELEWRIGKIIKAKRSFAPSK